MLKLLSFSLLLAIAFNSLITAKVEANLTTFGFRASKISRQHNPANCTVGNTTYAHGQTFKLDCKTQCVCENGRHACSSLCPKEQLPAPEDTISCRSPRLVEVPGHCCKMWLCENPTADVYATCHNSSSSPWTPCTQSCGLGISTRYTSTTTGCHQLSSLRLCENRKCDAHVAAAAAGAAADNKLENNYKNINHLVISSHKDIQDKNMHAAHRIRKGHECRSIQRLGPARIRVGACVSRKLYRPKLCGRCQNANRCCVPSVTTTIQVELLCPLHAMDPIRFAQQQPYSDDAEPSAQLWSSALEPIDQEYLQSHRVQIENKFIAVEWILKCECGKHENCNNDQKRNTKPNNYGDNYRQQPQRAPNGKENKNTSNYGKQSDGINENSDNQYGYAGAGAVAPYRDNAATTTTETVAAEASTLSWSSGELQPDIIPYPESGKRHQRKKQTTAATNEATDDGGGFTDHGNKNNGDNRAENTVRSWIAAKQPHRAEQPERSYYRRWQQLQQHQQEEQST